MTCSNCNTAHAPHELRDGMCIQCLHDHREGLLKECQMLREALDDLRTGIDIAVDEQWKGPLPIPGCVARMARANEALSANATPLYVCKDKLKPVVEALEHIAGSHDRITFAEQRAREALQFCRELGL